MNTSKIQSNANVVKGLGQNKSQSFVQYWKERAIDPKIISATVKGPYITYHTQVNGHKARFQRSQTVDWTDKNQRSGKETPHNAFERLSYSPQTQEDIPLFVSPDFDYSAFSDVYIVEGLPDAYSLLTAGLPAIALKSKGALQWAEKELRAFLEKFPNITEIFVIPDPDGWESWTQCKLWWGLNLSLTFVNVTTALKQAEVEGKDTNDLWKGLQDKQRLYNSLQSAIVHIEQPGPELVVDVPPSAPKNPPTSSSSNGDLQRTLDDLHEWYSGERMAEYALQNAPSPSQGLQEVGEEIEIRSNGGFYIKPSTQAWRIYGKNAGGIGIVTLASYLLYGVNSVQGQNFKTMLQRVAVFAGNEVKKESFHLTDLGNAKRLKSIHGENIRYCPEHDKWFIWSGTHWKIDRGKNITVYHHATDVVKALYTDASTTDDSNMRKEIGKWARRCESKKTLQDMVFLAAREPDLCIEQNDFDKNSFLLNVANGVLDLSTGKLCKHDRKHLLTKILPVAYNPKALCPEWLNFLNTIMAGNEGLIEFLRRAMGYTLAGDVSEDCLFFLHGNGKNGKSTFVNIFSHMLGDYRQHLKIESLLAKKYEGVPNDIAQLPGARLVTTTEIPEYRRLNESLVKDLTGGDAMTARFMRGEFFTFQPIFKLWMFGNHKPHIAGTDDGIWRRIRLIPFTVQIPKEDRLPRRVIEGTLKDEAEGILAWMVRGCLDWQKDGLKEPDEVLNATAEYRSEMDALSDFFEQYTLLGVEKVCAKKQMYNSYVEWSKEIGRQVEGSRRFNNKVRERFPNVRDDRGAGNKPIWRGIGLFE